MDAIHTVMNRPVAFPKLRPGISIVPFFSSADEKTYLVLLSDGRSLQTTRRLYELITHLDGSNPLDEIARSLSELWDCPVRPADVQAWIERYLTPYDLLETASCRPTSDPSSPLKPKAPKGIPLIPARHALPLSRRLCLLFRPLFCLPLLWASMACHGLLYYEFLSGPSAGGAASIPASGLPAGYLLILFSVLFHEFGHLSACTYFNCPHGEIRFGLYLVFPVFYANVSPAWRLSRKQRIVVDLGGMYFQMLLTIPLFFLFHATGGPLWRLLFLELDAMILFSLNPFLRFDGYWLCSDLLGVPNLGSRSRLLMRRLWGRLLGGPSIEEAPLLKIRPGARLGLAIYAIGTYLFGGLVLVFLCRILPARIQAFPADVGELVREALFAWSHGNVGGATVKLLQLLFLCVMLLATGRMLVRAGRPAARGAKRLVREGLSFRRIRLRDKGRGSPGRMSPAFRRPRSCSGRPGPRHP